MGQFLPEISDWTKQNKTKNEQDQTKRFVNWPMKTKIWWWEYLSSMDTDRVWKIQNNQHFAHKQVVQTVRSSTKITLSHYHGSSTVPASAPTWKRPQHFHSEPLGLRTKQAGWITSKKWLFLLANCDVTGVMSVMSDFILSGRRNKAACHYKKKLEDKRQTEGQTPDLHWESSSVLC